MMLLYSIAAALSAGALTAGLSLMVSDSLPPHSHLAPAALLAALVACAHACGLGEAFIWVIVGLPIAIGFLIGEDIPDPMRIHGPSILLAFIIGKFFAGWKKELGS